MKKQQSSWGQRLTGFLVFAGALVLTHQAWLPVVGTCLLVPDQVHKADAILVLRGEEYFRMGKGAELYKEGLAPVIMLSIVPRASQPYDMIRLLTHYENVDEAELTLRILEYFGVKREAVILTGKETTSTYQEAAAARQVMQQKGFKSMLLVTSTYHMRRAQFLFQRVFAGTGIEIYPVTGKHVLYDPARWWTHERDVRRVAEEYVSFMFNMVYYFQLKKHATSFDSV